MFRRAFTLIELLVTVAIIAVLIGILLPGLSAAREQGKRCVCMSNMRQIAGGIYNYWTEWNSRVPYVETPMTNGTGNPPRSASSVPGFGGAAWTDEDLNAFDRTRWPLSLPNVMMPRYLGEVDGVFACPAARLGWPRQGGRLRMTYRDAGANQPNGVVLDPQRYWYFREHFAFMDGRVLWKLRLELTGNPIEDAQRQAVMRGTYLRDLIRREGERAIGPHKGGIVVITRDLQVEYRSQKVTNEDLAPGFAGSQF